jgi:hypothetical protein
MALISAGEGMSHADLELVFLAALCLSALLSVAHASHDVLGHRPRSCASARMEHRSPTAASLICWHFSAFAKYRSDRDNIKPPRFISDMRRNDLKHLWCWWLVAE